MMGLTRCYKTAVFYILYLLFFDHNIIADVLPLPHLEYKRTHMENLHPFSMFNFLSSSSCNSARTKQILSEWDNHTESYDVV